MLFNDHLTAFLEYELSSASVLASTKRRRRLGRLACDSISILNSMLDLVCAMPSRVTLVKLRSLKNGLGVMVLHAWERLKLSRPFDDPPSPPCGNSFSGR